MHFVAAETVEQQNIQLMVEQRMTTTHQTSALAAERVLISLLVFIFDSNDGRLLSQNQRKLFLRYYASDFSHHWKIDTC